MSCGYHPEAGWGKGTATYLPGDPIACFDVTDPDLASDDEDVEEAFDLTAFTEKGYQGGEVNDPATFKRLGECTVCNSADTTETCSVEEVDVIRAYKGTCGTEHCKSADVPDPNSLRCVTERFETER